MDGSGRLNSPSAICHGPQVWQRLSDEIFRGYLVLKLVGILIFQATDSASVICRRRARYSRFGSGGLVLATDF